MDISFQELLINSEDKALNITVYNSKNQKFRELSITPSKKWQGGELLGVTLRFDTYHDADAHVIHVIEIEKESPADLAGIVEGEDYLLGTKEEVK